ncbi:MAG: LamG domain-containing protein [Planctomycetes bacterium]|nr:LamG domain-containing protein [Planctomycetota bacterium]
MIKRYLRIIVTISFIFCHTFFALADAEKDLVAHYTFDESSGSIVYDKSGNNNHGKIKGEPRWVRTETGAGLVFNGVDNYIDCGSAPSLDIKETGTVEIWYKLKSPHGGLVSRSTQGNWPGQRLVLAFNTYYPEEKKLMWYFSDGALYQEDKIMSVSFAPETLDIGIWTHLVLTFDGKVVEVYKNGVLIRSTFQEIKPETGGVPLRIGYCEGMGTPFFSGIIDEVRIYNRALSEEDVFSHFKLKATAKELKIKESIVEDSKLSKRTVLPVQKILNNFVTELLNIKKDKSENYEEYKFTNPRDGWIFISVDIKGKGKVYISVDSMEKEEAIIVHEKEGTDMLEAMRLLPAGEHRIKVWSEGEASLSLIVRAIPELLFRGFLGGPPIGGYEPSDYWEFLQRYIVKNINCMICGSGGFVNNPEIMSIVKEWKKQGKKWVHECGLPGTGTSTTASLEQSYTYWAGEPGFSVSLLDGIVVDEFGPRRSNEQFEVWTKAVKDIHENESLRFKTFYAYFGDPMYGNEYCRRFIDMVIDTNNKIAWEKYLVEQPTERSAKRYIGTHIKQDVITWRKEHPRCIEHMIMVLGYFSLPIVESLNVNPGVDYKVFMDMQFNLLANDPLFSGLCGVMEYSSAYAEEETVRWASELFRHYCIEGKKEMLSKKYGYKYILDHIQNPDFGNGTERWTVIPSEPDSVATKNMKGFKTLQGRIRPTLQGDNFL